MQFSLIFVMATAALHNAAAVFNVTVAATSIDENCVVSWLIYSFPSQPFMNHK